MAGIRTASHLYESGVKDVMIIEARDRLGGRLLTVSGTPTSDRPETRPVYDLGASWFHDTLNNPLFDRAMAKGNIEVFFDDGKLQYSCAHEIFVNEHLFQLALVEFITYGNLAFVQYPDKDDVSIQTLFAEFVECRGMFMSSEQIDGACAAARLWSELWHGITWDELLAKHALSTGSQLGRDAFVANGYSTVFQNELNELPLEWQENHIMESTVVSSIDYSKNDIIKVTTSKGIYYSDFLVLTIPQLLLARKDGQVSWIPTVPDAISQAFRSTTFGSLGKVVMEFDEIFWPSDTHRFLMLPSVDSKLPREKIQAWDYPVMMINYGAVKSVPSLVMIISEPLTRYIEGLSELEKDLAIWKLFKPLLRQISVDKHPAFPRNIIHSQWNNDIYARGAYGTYKVGSMSPSEIETAFAKGIDGRIFFAGAEMVSGLSNGCAHGAFISGENAATVILKAIRKN